jgi:hypothetical protein
VLEANSPTSWARDRRSRADVAPEPRAYYPPVEAAGEGGFVSGYVVPAAIARGDGTITAGGRTWTFANAPAYHDHNWGTWNRVHWDWGQVSSADHEFALVYGAVHAGALGSESGRRFVILTGRDGFPRRPLSPDSIAYARLARGGEDRARAVEDPLRRRERGRLARGRVHRRGRARVAPARHVVRGRRVFLQMRGTYEVSGRVGGRAVRFRERGAAETVRRAPEFAGNLGLDTRRTVGHSAVVLRLSLNCSRAVRPSTPRSHGGRLEIPHRFDRPVPCSSSPSPRALPPPPRSRPRA